MKTFTFHFLLFTTASLLLIACEKPETETPTTSTVETSSMHAIVLNEGPQGNNASLSWLDLDAGTLENDWFAHCNNRPLGNIAQDLIVYGSKAYVTVWKSGTLEVIDKTTGTSQQVNLGNRGPRYMAADGGKLYITCYNPTSIIRIDTATLQIEATCPLGGYNPEGIAIAAGKLFAVSSWIGEQQSEITYDDKVYVVDLATFANPTPVTVGNNPQRIEAVDSNTLIVNCWGAWNMNTGTTEGEGSALIDASTLAVTQTGQPLSRMTVDHGMVYGCMSTYDASWQMTTSYFKLDPATLTVTPLLTSCGINNPYSIGVHPVSGDIFIGTDGNYSTNGDLYCFSPDGTQRWKREVGLLPSKIVFY